MRYLFLFLVMGVISSGAYAQSFVPISLAKLSGFTSIAQAYGLPPDYTVTESEVGIKRGPAKEVSTYFSKSDILQQPDTQKVLAALQPGDMVTFSNVRVMKGSRVIKLALKNFVISGK